MRWLFNIFYAGALCGAAPYWLWRMPRARRYRVGVSQRLGRMPRFGPGRRLWVHTVSVGEAAIPKGLVARFRERHPDWEVVLSTATDTGAQRLREMYPDLPVLYWPFDFSPCVDRAMQRVRPTAVVLVELEVWPNFQLACWERHIPVVIVNGRINPPSARLLRFIRGLQPAVWRAVHACCARSTEDALRFVWAGLAPGKIVTTGSLKYDALALGADPESVDALRRLFCMAEGDRVLVGGSTHPGEEDVLCGVYGRLTADVPGLRLVLAPRHVERAKALERRLSQLGLKVLRKSCLDAGRCRVAGDEVILVDTIGDLPTCYALASCCFVGRSMHPPGGGQNVMEAAALGKPVVVGPHTGNFRPEMQLLQSRNAVVVVHDEGELEAQTRRLLVDRAEGMALGERARQAIVEARGATGRTLEHMERVLEGAGLLGHGV